jgi:hypothetical protein
MTTEKSTDKTKTTKKRNSEKATKETTVMESQVPLPKDQVPKPKIEAEPEATGAMVPLLANGGGIAAQVKDGHAAYAAANPEYPKLRFAKGRWYLGDHDEEIEPGLELVAFTPGMVQEWILFDDDRNFVDAVSMPCADGCLVRPDDGQDWKKGLVLVLADVATHEVYSFKTMSEGGQRALNRLYNQWVRRRYRQPGALPKVRIGCTSYKHPEHGPVFKPVFEVTGWVDGGPVATADGLDDEIPI